MKEPNQQGFQPDAITGQPIENGINWRGAGEVQEILSGGSGERRRHPVANCFFAPRCYRVRPVRVAPGQRAQAFQECLFLQNSSRGKKPAGLTSTR